MDTLPSFIQGDSENEEQRVQIFVWPEQFQVSLYQILFNFKSITNVWGREEMLFDCMLWVMQYETSI